MQQERDLIECRRLLMNFYSSQLQAHSRLIIGFAVIFLTLLQLKPQNMSTWQFWVFYPSVFVVALALYFLLMRHLVYGVLANAITHTDPKGEGSPLQRLVTGINKFTRKHGQILGHIPTRWFAAVGGSTLLDRLKGIVFCIVFAFFTTILAWILIG